MGLATESTEQPENLLKEHCDLCGKRNQSHASVSRIMPPRTEIASWQTLDIPIMGRSTIAIQ